MAKTKISEFSSTPANNTDIDSINIAEGCAPSGINDAIRELMAQLKDFQTGAAGDSFNGPVGTTTAAAGAFTTLTASSTATLNTLASSGATLTGGSINNMTIGGTTAAAVSATTLTTSSTVTLNGGTANGVAYLNGSKVLTSGSALQFDGSNLGLGVTPSAWGSGSKAMELPSGAALSSLGGYSILYNNAYHSGSSYVYKATGTASAYQTGGGTHLWFTAPSGTAGNAISFTQAMTLDASGNLLVGTTTKFSTERFSVNQTTAGAQALYTKNLSGDFNFNCWNAAPSGDNQFIQFITDASPTSRGSITYNRGAGLVAYNVTSDYRAKDIIGPVTDSGALIDSTPVYTGKMKGATQERPMFIAHETPAYAHTGVKDAVDADGNPVYQQMDASALVPVMWAELQSLRQRLAALEAA